MCNSFKPAHGSKSTFWPSTVPTTPLAGDGVNHGPRLRNFPFVCTATIASASGMLHSPARGLREMAVAFSSCPTRATTDTKRGLFPRELPVLSIEGYRTFSRTSSASAFLMRMPPWPHGPVRPNDMGVASPSAPAAMMSTETALTQG